MQKPVAVTMGEPAGIGGEILLKSWGQLKDSQYPFIAIDDPKRLADLAANFNIKTPLKTISSIKDAATVFKTALPVLALALAAPVKAGKPITENVKTVEDSIRQAVSLAEYGDARAVVTNPINKAIMQQGGFAFPGHTEFLSTLSDFDTPAVMMLATPTLRVVPVTVHMAIKDVPQKLTVDAIVAKAETTIQALQKFFGIPKPRLAIAGLNPHAGEDGMMGLEEKNIIIPAIQQLKQKGHSVSGPLSADTLFHAEARAMYDAAICMYHDQALIPLKTLDFWNGVNISLGLSFIRTSPDHGTGLDIAARGIAKPDSLIAAIKTAHEMADYRDKL
jgi:4-hydroxythreonine-4-phosphate dehydrogenase